MLNNIIRFSLQHRVPVMAAAILLLVAGLYVARHTEVDVFPELNAPTVTIMTEARGMAAEEVEQLVTFPIETAMNGATGVRRVRSSSTAGFSVVWVEFNWDTDIYIARQTAAEKLAAINDALPAGAGTPTMAPQSSILGELLIVGLTADSTSMLDLRTMADRVIRPRLLAISGVAQVAVLGGEVKEYHIVADPYRMRHYGIGLEQVLQATRDMNTNTTGGVANGYGNEYIIRGMCSTRDTAQIGRAVVATRNGTPITLADVADVRIGQSLPRLGTASEKGQPAVLLTVTKQAEAGTLELTTQIEQALEGLRPGMPADVRVSTDAFRQSRFIESAIGNVKDSLLEGSLFVVLVLFVFLANVRTTLISLVTIPLSLLVTILTLHFMGLTLNTMSLGGMAIAIGSLVDDAIVDVENVWKHLRANGALPPEQRRPIRQIVFEASREVRMPILNSTLIIVVSFVPLFFLSGMEGRMLVPLGTAFIVSLFASTLVALTLTPVLCSYLPSAVKDNARQGEPALVSWLKDKYRKALLGALAHKRAVMGCTLLILGVAIALFFSLGRSFLPPFNEGSFTINISAVPGITLEASDQIGRKAEELILEVPEILTVVRKTGRAELDEHALGVNVSEIEAPFELKERSHSEVLADLRHRLSALPGVNIEIGQPISHRIDAMLSGTKAAIAIKVFGDDLNRLYAIGQQIKAATSDVEGIADVNVEQLVERPELRISPRHEMLARCGITLPQFAQFVSAALGGEVVSQVYEDGRPVDLVVRMATDSLGTMPLMGRLLIDTDSGGKIELQEVADIVSAHGPHTINREDVKRRIVVSANATGRDVMSVVDDVKQRIAQRVVLPQGYHIDYGGQFESADTAGRVLLLTSLLSIAVIFMLLYMEFDSARQSVIILINLPLALIGGVFALLVSSGEVSIPAVIGFISLFGIATRNGMLLVGHYNDLLRQGKPIQETVVYGSLDRLNPILMTALSSALALIPLALRGDLPGNEIQSPMAKVILGGLLSATLLNLFVIPVVFIGTQRPHRSWLGSSKRLAVVLCGLASTAGLRAQSADSVLHQIASNNLQLRALAQQATAGKLSIDAERNIDDPTVEYSSFYSRETTGQSGSELVVTESFDFPTVYGIRRKEGNLRKRVIELEAEATRCSLMLYAKETCIELVRLNKEHDCLQQRATHADHLINVLEEQLKAGTATLVDVNKLKMERMSLEGDLLRNDADHRAALQTLLQLNGGLPINFDSHEFAPDVLPADFESLYSEAMAADPEIKLAQAQSDAAGQALSLGKASRLPRFEAGYRRNTEGTFKEHGFVIGGSLPLFSNRHRIKAAQAALVGRNLANADTRGRIEAELHAAWNEQEQMRRTLQVYDRQVIDHTLQLISQGVEAGRLGVAEYLVQAQAAYSILQEAINAEARYHKATARLTRHRL